MPLANITQLEPFNINSSATFSFANTSVTANVSAGNIKTDNLLYANGTAWTFGSTYSNTNVAAYLPTYSGNVSANYFSGNGSLLTSVTGANVTGYVATATAANTAGTVTTAAQPNITSVGTLTSVTVSGDATITGNLTVSGTYTYANVTSFIVKDPIIEQGGNPNGTPLSSNDGKDRGQLLHYYSSSAIDAFMGWDNSNAEFGFGSNVSVSSEVVTWNSYGNIRAGYFIGNGSQLTGLPASYSNTNVASYLPTYSGNFSPSNLVVSTSANLGSNSNVRITGGSSGQVLSTDGAGNLSWSSTTGFDARLDSFTGNGVQTQFALSTTPTNANYIIVMAGGIVQPHTAFSLSGSTLTFTSAPPAIPIEVTTMGGTVASGGGASASTVYGLSIVFGNGL